MISKYLNQQIDFDSLNVALLDIPMTKVFQNATTSMGSRKLALVSISDSGETGWGESAALNDRKYLPYSAEDNYNEIKEFIDNSNYCDTSALLYEAKLEVDNTSYAAIEMAVLDLTLKINNLGLHELSKDTQTEIGAVIPIMENIERELAINGLQKQGIKKIKLKTSPVDDVDFLLTVAGTFPNIEFHLDANASFAHKDHKQLIRYLESGYMAIEQPYPISETVGAIEITKEAEKLNKYIIADESASNNLAIAELIRTRQANAIAIKPGRLGGLTKALEAIELCNYNSFHASIGGMFETPLARSTLIFLDQLIENKIIGDINPPSEYLSESIFDQLKTSSALIAINPNSGINGNPDKEVLNRLLD